MWGIYFFKHARTSVLLAHILALVRGTEKVMHMRALVGVWGLNQI